MLFTHIHFRFRTNRKPHMRSEYHIKMLLLIAVHKAEERRTIYGFLFNAHFHSLTDHPVQQQSFHDKVIRCWFRIN